MKRCLTIGSLLMHSDHIIENNGMDFSTAQKLLIDIESDFEIVAEKDRQIESQKETIDEQYHTISTANIWNSKLKNQLDLAVKSLEWYADLENHKWHEDEEDVFKAPWTNVLNDCGSKAKLALIEINKLSKEREGK